MAVSKEKAKEVSLKERGLLGGIFYHNSLSGDSQFAGDILKIYPSTSFSTSKLREIAIVIDRLCSEGKEVNLMSVAELLHGHKFADLAELANEAPTLTPTRSDVFSIAQSLAQEKASQIFLEHLAHLHATVSEGRPITDDAWEIAKVAHSQMLTVGNRKKRPLELDPFEYMGSKYTQEPPEDFNWILDKSLLAQTLAAIIGTPSAGKGKMALALLIGLAAGVPIFNGAWTPVECCNVLYISAEDIEEVIHEAIFYLSQHLPKSLQEEIEKRVCAIPVSGHTPIFEIVAGRIQTTQAFNDLKNIILQVKPKVVFLDTLACFFGIPENENHLMGIACSYIKELISECNCSIILIHHTNKNSSGFVNNKAELYEALDQSSIRGATAFAGAIRWGLFLAPLSQKYAGEVIGGNAKSLPPGSFLAARVGKKNVGKPEETYFFKRDDHGQLVRVEANPESQEEMKLMDDVRQLVDEVKSRASQKQQPLSVSGGGEYGKKALGWGASRYTNAVQEALKLGLLVSTSNHRGRGNILADGSQKQIEFSTGM